MNPAVILLGGLSRVWVSVSLFQMERFPGVRNSRGSVWVSDLVIPSATKCPFVVSCEPATDGVGVTESVGFTVAAGCPVVAVSFACTEGLSIQKTDPIPTISKAATAAAIHLKIPVRRNGSCTSKGLN